MADQPLAQHIAEHAGPVVEAIAGAAPDAGDAVRRASGLDTNARLAWIESQMHTLMDPKGSLDHVFISLNVVHEHAADLDVKLTRLQ